MQCSAAESFYQARLKECCNPEITVAGLLCSQMFEAGLCSVTPLRCHAFFSRNVLTAVNFVHSSKPFPHDTRMSFNLCQCFHFSEIFIFFIVIRPSYNLLISVMQARKNFGDTLEFSSIATNGLIFIFFKETYTEVDRPAYRSLFPVKLFAQICQHAGASKSGQEQQTFK